jgi:putative ABC transport system ATP-binding protein
VIDLLLAAQRETGATLVVVTHDPAVARRLDRTIRLSDGQLAADAAPLTADAAPPEPPTPNGADA